MMKLHKTTIYVSHHVSITFIDRIMTRPIVLLVSRHYMDRLNAVTYDFHFSHAIFFKKYGREGWN